MNISVFIKSLQNIKEFNFSIDLSERNLVCITGRNGVGKTAIIKSIGLLSDIALLSKTSSTYSIDNHTHIVIKIDEKSYNYKFNGSEIDSRDVVEKGLVSVELPIPYGKRFSCFPSLGSIDKELREKYIKYDIFENEELVLFLSNVYGNTKFSAIKEVIIKNDKFYFLPLDNYKYIREDYFSSGEFFVVNLYKMIISECKLIVIDEIDISLDAAAQVNLIQAINELCEKYDKKVIFTTHSLPIMRIIYRDIGEPILMLDSKDDAVTLNEVSYGFVMGELFGFRDYDKYILTEDIMLEKYIYKIISGIETNKKIKIIYIGGASQVHDLMKRNKTYEFICNSKDMISILDGDSKEKVKGENIYYSPFLDIEDEVFRKYNEENDVFSIPNFAPTNAKSKFFCKKLIENIGMDEFFGFLEVGFESEISEFRDTLTEFITE